MNRKPDLSLAPVAVRPHSNGFSTSAPPYPDGYSNGAPSGGRPAAESESSTFDVWTFADALRQKWPWLLLAGFAFGWLAFWASHLFLKATHTASIQLVRQESPIAAELERDRQMSPQTFVSLFRSPELLQRVGARANPPMSARVLSENLRIVPEPDSEILTATFVGADPARVVRLANLYGQEAEKFTQEMQAKTAREVNRLMTQHLAHVQTEVDAVNERIRNRPRPAQLGRVETARTELESLLERYTDAHPLVQAQRSKLASIEEQVRLSPGRNAPRLQTSVPTVTNSLNGLAPTGRDSAADRMLAERDDDLELMRGQLQTLESVRLTLGERQRTLQRLEENPPGYYRQVAAAAAENVTRNGPEKKVIILTVFAGLIGMMLAGAMALLSEVMTDRVKDRSDVERITHLSVLGEAGNLNRMNEIERRNWAFRTWTNLQSRLRHSPNDGLICGFTSADAGEGRSTWVGLMAEAANQRGYRVLTISTKPSSSHGKLRGEIDADAVESTFTPYNSTALTPMALTTQLLNSPSDVMERLSGPDQQALLQIPLPGWVWGLERRQQWQGALAEWSQMGNVVILIELPPASVPETILLAENLPNVIWVSDAKKSSAKSTREQIQTLSSAGCRVAGAVLNRAKSSSLRNRFPRWVAAIAFASLLGVVPGIAAEDDVATDKATPPTQMAFSALNSSKRAAWQQKLTLGPGDVLNFSLYGETDLARTEVPVGPDGRVSYLEAQDIMAGGLTIDELRARFDEELGKFRRAPRTIVTPTAIRSKKYFVLGRVAQRGVYVLDRPMTIIEAVANAQGLETGQIERNTVDLADFSRSFLARDGRRMKVDFEKLFQQGDLSQNIALEPNDYLFFPASEIREIYVLGEVKSPGPVAFRPELGAVGAIAVRGGFTDRSWRTKILVVRGSINRPETFEVDTASVVKAQALDFRLKPKDIIYVNARPWIKAEELLDAVATGFIEASIITATGKIIN